MSLRRLVQPPLPFVILVALHASLGSPVLAQPARGLPLSENFDGVTPPALPYGWVATTPQGSEFWVTDSSKPDSGPIAAHLNAVSVPADERLDSPPVAILTARAQLRFRHAYLLAVDPGSLPESIPVALAYLEISISGSPFEDIVDAGGAFVEGGYEHDAWTGEQPMPEYGSVIVDLPESLAGKTVVFRWRLTTAEGPNGPGSGQWWIDTVQVCDGFACDAVPQPAAVNVDPSGNGVWEPGEIVEVDPVYVNNGSQALDLTGTITNLTAPGPVTFVVADGSASYGSVAPGAAGACVVTDDCYLLMADQVGTRPVQHWDVQVFETLSTGATVDWALHLGGSFGDVPASNGFYKSIETVFHRGVTGGCGVGNYCPGNPALRKQMAVFLLKSKYGAAYVPPAATGVFSDVPVSDPFAPWIENLYALGVTGGCSTSPLAYCPDQAVRRKQMAVFLLKTRYGSDYAPPACEGIFADVPCPGAFADWIEDLANRQITGGCGNGDFCPDDPNTRGQMAVFLTKTFGLALYGP